MPEFVVAYDSSSGKTLELEEVKFPSSMKTDASSWILGTPKLLSQKGIEDVKFKTAECCLVCDILKRSNDERISVSC